MSRKVRKKRFEGESFGMPLADLLTTALGCIMLIFIVSSTYMKEKIEDQGNTLNKIEDLNARLEQATKKFKDQIKVLTINLKSSQSQLDQTQNQLNQTQTQLTQVQAQEIDLKQQLDNLSKVLGSKEVLLKEVSQKTNDILENLAKPVDIMLVIDGTKSMKPSLDATRKNLAFTVDILRTVSPDVRVGVTVFRDKHESKKDRIEYQKLTKEVKELNRFLKKIEAKSTKKDKDIPEWLCGGINQSIKANWRNNSIQLMVVVSDADDQSKNAKECIKKAQAFAKGGGQVHMISTFPDRYKQSRKIRTYYKDHVLKEHKAIAKAGGGRHITNADGTTLLKEVLKSAFHAKTTHSENKLKNVQKALQY